MDSLRKVKEVTARYAILMTIELRKAYGYVTKGHPFPFFMDFRVRPLIIAIPIKCFYRVHRSVSRSARARLHRRRCSKKCTKDNGRSRTTVIPRSDTRLRTLFPRTWYEGNIADSLKDVATTMSSSTNLNYFSTNRDSTPWSSSQCNTNCFKTIRSSHSRIKFINFLNLFLRNFRKKSLSQSLNFL